MRSRARGTSSGSHQPTPERGLLDDRSGEGRCTGCGRGNHSLQIARLRRARRAVATPLSIARRPAGCDAWPRRGMPAPAGPGAAPRRRARQQAAAEGPIGGSVKYWPGRIATTPPARWLVWAGPLGQAGPDSWAARSQGGGARGLIGMRAVRPSAWADARPDARRPLAAPGLSVARAAAPAAAGGGDCSARAEPGAARATG